MLVLLPRVNADDSLLQFEEEEEVQPGGFRVVPEELLQTDTRVGLTSEEVIQRRRKYGLNQMKYVLNKHFSATAELAESTMSS